MHLTLTSRGAAIEWANALSAGVSVAGVGAGVLFRQSAGWSVIGRRSPLRWQRPASAVSSKALTAGLGAAISLRALQSASLSAYILAGGGTAATSIDAAVLRQAQISAGISAYIVDVTGTRRAKISTGRITRMRPGHRRPGQY